MAAPYPSDDRLELPGVSKTESVWYQSFATGHGRCAADTWHLLYSENYKKADYIVNRYRVSAV